VNILLVSVNLAPLSDKKNRRTDRIFGHVSGNNNFFRAEAVDKQM